MLPTGVDVCGIGRVLGVVAVVLRFIPPRGTPVIRGLYRIPNLKCFPFGYGVFSGKHVKSEKMSD
jgi:hypothetical protein